MTLDLKTEVNGWLVSTVELPCATMNGHWYETMVFPMHGPHVRWTEAKGYRARTSEGARAYHEVACQWARAHDVKE